MGGDTLLQEYAAQPIRPLYNTLSYDDYPNYAFDGLCTFIGMEPTTTPAVRSYDVIISGPGSTTPGRQLCQYVETNPTVVDFLEPPFILIGNYKFNSHSVRLTIPIPIIQDFGIAFPAGDYMSCAEIAYNYDLTPDISPDRNSVGSGGSVGVTPNVTVKPKDPAHPATNSDKAHWQISEFYLPNNQSPSSIVREGQSFAFYDDQPCSFFVAKDGAKDCTIPKWTNGTKAQGADWRFDVNNLPMDGKSWLHDLAPYSKKKDYKVCYALSIAQYQSYQPYDDWFPYWRHSKVFCLATSKTPTVQVWGGDVRVGRPFGDDDSGHITPTDSGVYTSTFTMPDGKMYGSWAEYGVFAPKAIKSIASMSGLAEGFTGVVTNKTGDATCDTTALNRLTFANDVHAGDISCGGFGDTGAIPNVVATYTAWKLAATSPLSNASPINVGTLATGRYEVGSPTGTIHLAATTVGEGKHMVLDLQGRDVVIDGSIQYADEKSPGVPYEEVSEVPQLIIIAKNITIQAGAKRVDAWLIADGKSKNTSTGAFDYANSSATDGTVKTCEPNSSGPKVTANMCQDKLTINGPIMARHLELLRTGGADDTSPTCDSTAASPDCPAAKEPAEIIDLPGTTLIWSALPPANPRALTTYTVELPPYF